jgi:hypothetical protein
LNGHHRACGGPSAARGPHTAFWSRPKRTMHRTVDADQLPLMPGPSTPGSACHGRRWGWGVR